MTKRRKMHYSMFALNNPNMVRDYSNTFCYRPQSVPHGDLSHYKHFGSDHFMPNTEEFNRLTANKDDDMAASLVFNTHVSRSTLPTHRVVTSSLLEMRVADLNQTVGKFRSEAITALLTNAKKYMKPVIELGIEKVIMFVSGFIHPKYVKGLVKFLTGKETSAEGVGKLADQLMGDAGWTDGAKNLVKGFWNKTPVPPMEEPLIPQHGPQTKAQQELTDTIERLKTEGALTEEEGEAAKKLIGRFNEFPHTLEDLPKFDSGLGSTELQSYLKSEVEPLLSEMAPVVLDEGAPAAGAAAAEAVGAIAGDMTVAAAAGAAVAEAAMPLLTEMLPIVAMTALMMGIQAWQESRKADQEAEQARQEQAEERKRLRQEFVKYYDLNVDLDFSEGDDTPYRKEWLKREGVGNSMKFSVLLKKIITNELSIHAVSPSWLRNHEGRPHSDDLLTAEMVRELRIVDHYLRDTPAYPVHENNSFKWEGGAPFPPIVGDPMTYVKDAMTPLPVMNKRFVDTLTKYFPTWSHPSCPWGSSVWSWLD